jgi:hypothetical protein
MKSVEYDLRFIQAGLEMLEEYLLSEDVFWPMGANPPQGEPDYPQLTLDWILQAGARLEARQLSFEQKEQVQGLITDLDLNRSRWRVAWEKKARQCFQVRLKMWQDFLQEYKDNPQDNADRYAYEVRLRTMLELLMVEFQPQNADDIESLSHLDKYLRVALKPAGFIWEGEIQAGFPREKYWFLYGKLPASGGEF